MKNLFCIISLPILVISCATPEPQQTANIRYGTPVQASPSLKPSRRVHKQPAPEITGSRAEQVRGASVSLATAVSAPLDDFNLRRKVAPKALENLGYIYQASPRPNCAAIARELYVVGEALDEIDADDLALKAAAEKTRREKASDTTLEVVRSTSSSLIPFSGVVRAVSGANKVRRKYDANFDKGRRRRAFLKGYALGIGCNAPTSPKVLYVPDPPPDPEYGQPKLAEKPRGSR
ncbi:hypothetical protein MNBD_ALPHA06-767 [hydrothermal vent metagenome]|uniref:Lipoprotein n=1 Tax=hydrothermal vent metagenome TaxID=652676 RepID=A0A3B0RY30_9ZZZZ